MDIHQTFSSYFKSEPKAQQIAFLLSKKLEQGSICIQENSESDFIEHRNSKFIGQEGDEKPIIRHQKHYYLQKYFNYESDVVQKIKVLNQNAEELYPKKNQLLGNIEDVLKSLFFDTDKNNSTNQLLAALNSFVEHFSVITGGPGTGKTTSIKLLLYLFYKANPHLNIELLAPTGKAAARMHESLLSDSHLNQLNQTEFKEFLNQLQASTIHRSLKIGSKNIQKILSDIIIVDEASMIDVSLMSKLLRNIDDKSQIILIGDKNQLSSVEAGSLFGDICGSYNSKVQKNDTPKFQQLKSFVSTEKLGFSNSFELKTSYRFKEGDGIGKLSENILKGSLDISDENYGLNIQFQPNIDSEEFKKQINQFESFIGESDIRKAILKSQELKVLCALKNGPLGSSNINIFIQDYLASKGLLAIKGRYFNNMPILVTSNNYEIGLFNGDTGLIRANSEGMLMAYFIESDGNVKEISPVLIQNFECSFAMTIHKSQGSEYESIALVLPDKSDSEILSRELLYTGVTRAKKSVTIYGQKEIINAAVSKKAESASGIERRLMN